MEKKFVSAVIYLNNSEKEIIPFLNITDHQTHEGVK